MRPLQPKGLVLAVAAKLQAVLALPLLDGLGLGHSVRIGLYPSPTVCDVKLITVRLPCRFTARELDNATSPLDYLGERVAYDALTLLAPPRTAEADFWSVCALLTEENEERVWLIFHAGSIV